MTKKDYILLARVMAESRPGKSTTSDMLGNWQSICLKLAAELKNENPRFDYDKFLKACGYGE